jgi:3-oxoacid CoA-transferase B subunit
VNNSGYPAGTDPAPRLDRAAVAKRAARDLFDGSTVNLGIGIPALCANFLPDGVELLYHAENGILGFKELSAPGEGDPNLMDAGGKFPKLVPGMAFFDSVESFSLIRGGHIDVTVLGASDFEKWRFSELDYS